MQQPWKKRIKLIISLGLSALIIYLIYRKLDFHSLTEVLMGIRPLPAVFFLLLFIPQLWLATLRWNVMTREIGKYRFSMNASFAQVVGSYSANLLIPGKMGEIVRIPWMRKYPLKAPVIALVLLEKVFDILSVILLLFASLGMIFLLSGQYQQVHFYFWLASLLFLLTLALVYVFRKPLSFFIERIFSSYLEKKPEDFIYYRFKTILGFVNKRIVWFFLISILLWMIQILEFYTIFLMFDIHPPILHVYGGSSLALLAGALPVSVAGLGPRDAVIISYFSQWASVEVLAGVGIISLFRIIIPALTGIPCFLMQTKR